ncbi:MAG: HD-GYP domain-containing protein [Syntrophomonadaceae bacterium]|nr:HD-GYP domain-containing protein [Syntrophomonadaceae bacterium]
MRRISIEYAEPGMVNARSIYNSEGRVLLAAGVALNQFYLERLSSLGIRSLYVRDEVTGDLMIPEVVSEKVRVETLKTVRSVFLQLEASHQVNTRAVRQAVDQLLEEVLANPHTLVHLTDIRSFDDYLFAHSVNVCLLSLMTGISLAMNTIQLRELGVGALLHDIGKTAVSREIINKTDPLTPEEFDEIKTHTTVGFDILRKHIDISLLSSHVAFQHHERQDGSGYPRGLRADEIHEYARIVAVTDVYDALLADCWHRPAFLPHEAVRELTHGAYTRFDPRAVAALLENVAIYPVGSVVQLNTGEVGIVVDVNKAAQKKPVVRLVVDQAGQRLTDGREIDLDKFHTVYIVKVFSNEVSYSLLQEVREGRQFSLSSPGQEKPVPPKRGRAKGPLSD